MSETQPQTQPLADPVLLETAVHSTSAGLLEQAASSPSLTEALALTLLKHSDLPAAAAVALSKNASVSKLRKVRLAIVQHPRTPRHVSLPLLRLLYTFDVMSTALAPTTPADLKRSAEAVLLTRVEKLSPGERLSLARRASGPVAAELLMDKDARVMHAALENPRLNQAVVLKALARADAPAPLVSAISHHPKWSTSRDIRLALLRNQNTPLGRALEFARSLPPRLLRETLENSRMPSNTKGLLLHDLDAKSAAASSHSDHPRPPRESHR